MSSCNCPAASFDASWLIETKLQFWACLDRREVCINRSLQRRQINGRCIGLRTFPLRKSLEALKKSFFLAPSKKHTVGVINLIS